MACIIRRLDAIAGDAGVLREGELRGRDAQLCCGAVEQGEVVGLRGLGAGHVEAAHALADVGAADAGLVALAVVLQALGAAALAAFDVRCGGRGEQRLAVRVVERHRERRGRWSIRRRR